jgi:hypothetical protein
VTTPTPGTPSVPATERSGVTILGPGPDMPPATPTALPLVIRGDRGPLTPPTPAPTGTTTTGTTPPTIKVPYGVRLDTRGVIGTAPATLPPAPGGLLLR